VQKSRVILTREVRITNHDLNSLKMQREQIDLCWYWFENEGELLLFVKVYERIRSEACWYSIMDSSRSILKHSGHGVKVSWLKLTYLLINEFREIIVES